VRSWKTTTAAALTAAASLVMFMQNGGYYDVPRWALGLAMFCHVGGLVAFGVAAKDYNVSGTNAPPSADKATK